MFEACNFYMYVQDCAKWDLGRATYSGVTLGTRQKHSLRDFRLSFQRCQNIFGYFWLLFHQNWTRFLNESTVSSSITIWSLATIWMAAMCILFSHFEVRVTSRDCRIVIYTRIDNWLVHFSYKGTNNGWRVHLKLLKSYKDVNKYEELVIWLKGLCRFWSVETFLDLNIYFPKNTC